MIVESGDGTWAERFSSGRCPSCRTALPEPKENDTRVEYKCPTCKLRIIDTKGIKK